jgi:hypothetical protein
MTPWMTVIVTVFFLGLLGLTMRAFAWERRLPPLLLVTAVLAGLALTLDRMVGFPSAESILASGKLPPSEMPQIGLLFACMLLGMLAHWLYVWLETPQRKRPAFDLGVFIAPALASPIVFIPLLASQQNTSLEPLHFDTARFMVFLVAFENGFFWKECFDNRRAKEAE